MEEPAPRGVWMAKEVHEVTLRADKRVPVHQADEDAPPADAYRLGDSLRRSSVNSREVIRVTISNSLSEKGRSSARPSLSSARFCRRCCARSSKYGEGSMPSRRPLFF